MPYKVRMTKREDGYDLSYGKGKQKVLAITKKDPSNNKWFVDSVGHFPKLGDLKVAWGRWAADQYTGTGKTQTEETVPTGHVPPPPPSRRKPKPKGNGLVPIAPPGLRALAAYAANDKDPEFVRPDGKPTPLGMLLEIQAWHERYRERITEVNHKLALSRTPGFNPFSFLRLMIDECAEREIPDTNQKESDDGTI